MIPGRDDSAGAIWALAWLFSPLELQSHFLKGFPEEHFLNILYALESKTLGNMTWENDDDLCGTYKEGHMERTTDFLEWHLYWEWNSHTVQSILLKGKEKKNPRVQKYSQIYVPIKTIWEHFLTLERNLLHFSCSHPFTPAPGKHRSLCSLCSFGLLGYAT